MVVFTGASVEEAIQEGLRELDIPRMKAHITVISREKKGFLGLFGKKPAQVDVEPISETTMVKANQKAVKGVPEEVNAKNEPVKSVSEETVDIWVGLSLPSRRLRQKVRKFQTKLRQKSSNMINKPILF